jgi:hypothetical protein
LFDRDLRSRSRGREDVRRRVAFAFDDEARMEKRVRLVEDGTLARETRLGDAFERDANLVQLRALDVVV